MFDNNVPPRTFRQSQTQDLPHVSLLAPVQREDTWAQMTECFDLVVHVVALVNRIREDIDPLISPTMIRRRVFCSCFRDILNAVGVLLTF